MQAITNNIVCIKKIQSVAVLTKGYLNNFIEVMNSQNYELK